MHPKTHIIRVGPIDPQEFPTKIPPIYGPTQSLTFIRGPIDQLEDRDPCKVEAAGSSPAGSILLLIHNFLQKTIIITILHDIHYGEGAY